MDFSDGLSESETLLPLSPLDPLRRLLLLVILVSFFVCTLLC